MTFDMLKPYLYGALALAGLAAGWWLVNTVQKAALYEASQAELGMANDTIEQLVNENMKEQEKRDAEAKKRHETRIRLEALERRFAGIAAAGDAAAFNRQLCELLEGITGAHFERETDAAGSACDEAARGEPKYTLSEESAARLLTNLSRIRAYVDGVEAVK